MNAAMRILESRDTTSFFMSIGTGLMMETLFDPITTRIDDGRTHDKINVNDYKVHYINIRTLVRNIIQSISNNNLKKSLLSNRNGPSAVVETLIGELESMNELYSGVNCKLVIYIPTYKTVLTRVKNAIKIEDMSDSKAATERFTIACMEMFKLSGYNNVEVLKIDFKLPSVEGKVLITTHYTYDLLNIKLIRKLELLESHTGKIKDIGNFNTKYHSMGRLDRDVFPFQERLLYIIGDTTLIKPMKFKVRSELHKLAVEKRWTAFTSDMKIKSNIQFALNEYIDINDIKLLF